MKSTTTGDPALIRRINTGIALDAVLKGEPLSRAAISAGTGLNKATVSSLVQDLLDRGLLTETGQGASSGGRKPVMLEFRASAGCAIGIDVGATYLMGVRADLRGEVLAELRRPMEAAGGRSVMEQLIGFIEELLPKQPPQPYGVVGIGIGLPGIVDGAGSLLLAPHMDWEPTEVARRLEERFGVPVHADNEANFGAQGERIFGAAAGIRHLVYVSAGMGIGTGLVLDGQLYRGASGFSGELGHLSIQFDGPACRCGNRGCWERFASEQAALESAAAIGCGSLEELAQLAEQGHSEALRIWDEIGSYLGIGIATIINVFNPEAVLIGSRLSMAARWLEPAVQREVQARALPFHRRQARVRFAELGDGSAVRGAAWQAAEGFLARVKAGEA